MLAMHLQSLMFADALEDATSNGLGKIQIRRKQTYGYTDERTDRWATRCVDFGEK